LQSGAVRQAKKSSRRRPHLPPTAKRTSRPTRWDWPYDRNNAPSHVRLLHGRRNINA